MRILQLFRRSPNKHPHTDDQRRKALNPVPIMASATTTEGGLSESTDVHVLARFVFGPAGMVAIAGLATGWPSEHWGMRTCWVLVASYAMFCWTSCFHEAAHQTLGGSKRLSILVGRIVGTMIFVPYHVYRESHIRHHAYLNKSTDWELWPYSDPDTSLWFRRIFCWLEIPFGIFTSPYVYGRLYFRRDSPLVNPQLRRVIGFEYLTIAVVWSAVILAVAYSGTWRIFLLAWVLPHWVAAVFQTFRKFTEHLGMASYDPLLGTRTVIGDGWITRLSTYLNFDIFVHGPHHRHPRFRHDALCDRMHDYQTAHPELEYPVFRSYRSALWHLLPSIIRNPGVGMNVGAPAPAEEKPHDASDFGEDVTAQILGDNDAIVVAAEDDR